MGRMKDEGGRMNVEKGDRHLAATRNARHHQPVARSQSPFSTGRLAVDDRLWRAAAEWEERNWGFGDLVIWSWTEGCTQRGRQAATK